MKKTDLIANMKADMKAAKAKETAIVKRADNRPCIIHVEERSGKVFTKDGLTVDQARKWFKKYVANYSSVKQYETQNKTLVINCKGYVYKPKDPKAAVAPSQFIVVKNDGFDQYMMRI